MMSPLDLVLQASKRHGTRSVIGINIEYLNSIRLLDYGPCVVTENV